MIPYFNSYTYKNTDFGQSNAFIQDILLSGGTGTLTVNWVGSNGYTAGPYVGNPSTDLTNLAAGTYTGTVVDSLFSASTTIVTISEKPELTLSATVTDNSCITGGCSCEITVWDFTHDINCFEYQLLDGVTIVDTYTGCTGDEFHVFTGLCVDYLTLVATETTNTIYEYSFISGCSTDTISFDDNDSVSGITENWTRFSFMAYASLTYSGGSLPSGLDPITGIVSNAVGTYFERGVGWDLGNTGLTMTEGEDVGPVTSDSLSLYKYYYNTYINKYVFCSDVTGAGNYQWTTFDPRENVGLSLGNPTATQQLTTSSNWTVQPLTSNQYTVSGISNTVVLASDKLTDDSMIQCASNSAWFNGFYSVCNFIDYVHEVTIGSTAADDDEIGIVISAYKDITGLYGPSGVTHTLSLVFGNRKPNQYVEIVYNIGSGVYGFNTGSTYSSLVLLSYTDSPFDNGNPSGQDDYYKAGNVRVKIIKSGSSVVIYTTETMGDTGGTQTNATVNVGESNPYRVAPLFSFDLLDKNTWSDAPAYAVGNELEKFVDNSKIGYLTASQPLTQFYDITFSGDQTSYSSSDQSVLGDSITEMIGTPPPECFTCKNVITLCDDKFEGCGDLGVSFQNLLTTEVADMFTVDDFTNTLLSELIDVKNRQTISAYPTLRALYDRYLNSSKYCSTDSSGFNYITMDQFAGLLGNYWVDLVEQVVPATTIWGSIKVYSNTVFDQQKYQYKKGTLFTCLDNQTPCNVDTLNEFNDCIGNIINNFYI